MDGIAILRQKSLSGVHFNINIAKTTLSMQKIYSIQKKQSSFQKGDYIIAISSPDLCIFKKDCMAENLLHFESLYHFFKWLNKSFGNNDKVQIERGD